MSVLPHFYFLQQPYSSGQNRKIEDIFDFHPSLPVLSSPPSTALPTLWCPRRLEFSKGLCWNLKIWCLCLVLSRPQETYGDSREEQCGCSNESRCFQGSQGKPGITIEEGSKKYQSWKSGAEHWERGGWDMKRERKLIVRSWDDRSWFKRMVQNEVRPVAQDHWYVRWHMTYLFAKGFEAALKYNAAK